MALRREAPLNASTAGLTHCLLACRVAQQLVECRRQSPGGPGTDQQAADPVLEPVGDRPGGACDDRSPGGMGLDANQAERLGPDRGHHEHGGFGELPSQLSGREPAPEREALLDAQLARQPSQPWELPALAADDEFALHLLRGAHEHSQSLGRNDPAREQDAAALLVAGGLRGGECREQGHDAAWLDRVRRQVLVDRAAVGDGQIGQPQRLDGTGRSSVGARQRARIMRVGTATEGEVCDAAGAVGRGVHFSPGPKW